MQICKEGDMMEEIWDLYDKNKNKTGVTHKRVDIATIPEGMYHMVVEVWVKRPDGKILFTKRHPDKHYPLLWECSGGSAVSGEISKEAASRELFEETGIWADKNQLIYLGDTVSKLHFTDTYLYKVPDNNVKLNLQLTEVVDSMWLDAEEIIANKEVIVPTVWDRYQKYKEKIHTL